MKLNEVMQVVPVNQMVSSKIARQLAFNVSQSFSPQAWEAAAEKALQRFMGQIQVQMRAEIQQLKAKRGQQ